jgi:N-acetylglucosaminyl-diphospho-decaprenol L-rhamnosyltransferase
MTGMFEQVTVVCVTFNSGQCVATIARDFEHFANVIVVDNASVDSTVARLREALPRANVIANERNLGFGAANNLALAQVKTTWALLINPDCEIETSALDALLHAGEHYQNAALLAPQAIHEDGTLQECYGPAFYNTQPRGYTPADSIVGAQWLSGCCLLLRMSCFPNRQAFDERFFLYYEDDDLALDVQRRGYECLLVPGATVKHIGNGSSTPTWRAQLFKDFHYQLSKRLIIAKYLGSFAALMHRAKLAIGGAVAIPIYAVIFKRKYLIRWLGWFGSAFARGVSPPR